jgi:hypothetical protein
MPSFLPTQPSNEDYWRGIVLLGRNVATYKLALAKSLLQLAPAGKTFITMEELAAPFTQHLAEHLHKADKQITSSGSQFLDTCRKFNLQDGSVNQTQLIESAVRLGFNNVIDAFHVVNNAPIPQRFYVDERKSKGGITLTDTLLQLVNKQQAVNFPLEVEARWRLVETAWSLGLPPRLLNVRYDGELERLFVETENSRTDITGCREALSGYQKGRCFYCFKDITLDVTTATGVDVDHFFPRKLWEYSEFAKVNLDGVWNLVLSCQECNRGVDGKFMRVPMIHYLARLYKRNNFFIESHHPLRETLINQTGFTPSQRHDLLQQLYGAARSRLLIPWQAAYEQEAAF